MLVWLHQLATQIATALILTGVLFDVLGLFRKADRFVFVGFWNILLGAVAAFAAVATGWASALALGPHDKMGDALLRFHVVGAAVMTATAALMAGARLAMKGLIRPAIRMPYMALGLFVAVIVLLTGAFGMVVVHSFGLSIEAPTAKRVIDASGLGTPMAGGTLPAAPSAPTPPKASHP